MITVGVNCRALTKPNPAGVSRYTAKLLTALAERESDRRTIEYLLFGVDSLPDALAGYDHVHTARECAPAHSGLRAHYWEQITLPRALSKHDIDVFHTPAGHPPILARLPLVTTLHDISPITHPEWFSTEYAFLYRILTPLAVRTSDRIITVSESARDEIISKYAETEDKIVSVYNGVMPVSGRDSTPVEKLQTTEYVLFVGSTNPRKNLATLLEGYQHYRERASDPVSLVLAGPDRGIFAGQDYEEGDGDGVHSLGFVSDEELAWLYDNAAAFVFPSLYEGFGLPILEAMSVGTPVITSNRGAMAEVGGTAAHLVDPLRPRSIADGIEQVVDDVEVRERLIKRGYARASNFTWERTAEQTAEVYRQVAAQNE